MCGHEPFRAGNAVPGWRARPSRRSLRMCCGIRGQHPGGIGNVAGSTLLLILQQWLHQVCLSLFLPERGTLKRSRSKRHECAREYGSESDTHVTVPREVVNAVHDRAHYGLSVMSQLRMSAFSSGVQSRPTTSPQLRRSHFSVFVAFVNRSGLNAGASGAIVLPVAACCPFPVAMAPWHVAQAQSCPCRMVKNCWPREGAGTVPACAEYPSRICAGVSAYAVETMKKTRMLRTCKKQRDGKAASLIDTIDRSTHGSDIAHALVDSASPRKTKYPIASFSP